MGSQLNSRKIDGLNVYDMELWRPANVILQV